MSDDNYTKTDGKRGKSRDNIELKRLNEAANETLGVSMKPNRFVPENYDPTISEKRRDAGIIGIQLILMSAAYRAQYERVSQLISDAGQRLDDALIENARDTETAQGVLEALENDAVCLADGTAIFLSADGRVKTAEGHLLSSDAVPASLYSKLQTSPRYEIYAQARDAANAARVRARELAGYAVEIDAMSEEMADDRGVTSKRMHEIEDQVKRVVRDLDNIPNVKASFEAASSKSLDENPLNLSMIPMPG